MLKTPDKLEFYPTDRRRRRRRRRRIPKTPDKPEFYPTDRRRRRIRRRRRKGKRRRSVLWNPPLTNL